MYREAKFKVGDIVQLKSGGPDMTVDQVNEHGPSYHCKWFSGTKAQEEIFDERALNLVEDEESE